MLEIGQVPEDLAALEFRERVIAHLAIFVGIRPGEILALQRRHIKDPGIDPKVAADQRGMGST